jgi:hypothetical protein
MQRKRFVFNLGLLGAAALLVSAALAFGPTAVVGVGLGIGIVGLLGSLSFLAAVMHHRSLAGARQLRLLGIAFDVWSLLAGGVIGVALWETVQSAVFAGPVARWLTLANGVLAGTFGCIGLVLHELTTERVIHVLEVVERPQ